MKNTFKIIIYISLLTIVISCKDDEVNRKPQIDNFELGYENNRIAYANHDLHISAEIQADAKIDYIKVFIHPEEEHHLKSVFEHDEWMVDSVYTKFKGLKNTQFHKHVDLPNYAEAGDYHFHFSVVDLEGNSAEINQEFEVKEDDGEEHHQNH